MPGNNGSNPKDTVEEVDQAKLQRLIKQMDKIAEPEEIKPNENAVVSALKKIPVFARAMDTAGTSLTGLFVAVGHTGQIVTTASTVLPILGVGIAAADLALFPLNAISNLVTGQKQEFKTTWVAKLIYLAAILALSVALVLFPPLAIPLALGMSVLVFATAVGSLVKHFKNRTEVMKELDTIAKETLGDAAPDLSTAKDEKERILLGQQREKLTKNKLEDNLNESRVKAKEESAKLQALQPQGSEPVQFTQEEKEKYNKIIDEFVENKKNAQHYVDQKATLKRMNDGVGFEKLVAIGALGGGVIGVLLTIVLPPLGFLVTALAATFASVYILTRVVNKVRDRLANRNVAVIEPGSDAPVDDATNSQTVSLVSQNNQIPSSSSQIIESLSSKDSSVPKEVFVRGFNDYFMEGIEEDYQEEEVPIEGFNSSYNDYSSDDSEEDNQDVLDQDSDDAENSDKEDGIGESPSDHP
ncbi:MAG: hypothetical protein WC785_00335 [Tatlockia sp.]